MLNSPAKAASNQPGPWEGLSAGALTHFVLDRNEAEQADRQLAAAPHWSLLAGEVEETAKDLIVRVEVPGMNGEDCRITIDGNMLYISGHKRCIREAGDSTYHITERAYGAFQRAIPLPRNVDSDRARTSFRDGVLTVHLPKSRNFRPWLSPVR